MISAKVVADSKAPNGARITTMVVTMPRIILAEFNTHRMFSRNSASSRAIPFKKMLTAIEEEPFIPMAWQKDHSGMQGTEYFTDKVDIEWLVNNHLAGRDYAIERAKAASDKGLTKQIINRYLEPFMWQTVIVTATEWENFFALRCPRYELFDEGGTKVFRSKKDAIKFAPDLLDTGIKAKPLTTVDWLKINKGGAEIHMMEVAEQMYDALQESTPKELKEGEYHIPFGDKIFRGQLEDQLLFKDERVRSLGWVDAFESSDPEVQRKQKEYQAIETEYLVKIAVARCARVSYTVVGEEGKPDNYENDVKLHDRLASQGHWSPFEHIAQAMYGSSGNFTGFVQYRKTFKNENITK